MGVWEFLNSTPVVIVFYAAVFCLIYLNRRRFEFQSKIVGIRRTKAGIAWIGRTAARHGSLIRRLARILIWPSFLFMLLISFYLLDASVKLFTHPEAPAGVTPILPGVKVPGSTIHLPLWYGIIAIFIIATVHEGAHGIVAAANGFKIKSTGFFFMGPLFGAFVEPDEKKLKKAPTSMQNAVFAAGPMAKILLALLALGLMLSLLSLGTAIARPAALGVGFATITPDYPASLAGVQKDVLFVSANGRSIASAQEFITFMEDIRPGDSILLVSETGSEYTLIAGQHPDRWTAAGYTGVRRWLLQKITPDSSGTGTAQDYRGMRKATVQLLASGGSGEGPGYIGVSGIVTEFGSMGAGRKAALGGIGWWGGFFWWVLILSSGIGLFNLLPLGPTDGGRMIQLVLRDWRGQASGDRLWKQVSTVFIVLLVMNLLVPMARTLLNDLLLPAVQLALNATLA